MTTTTPDAAALADQYEARPNAERPWVWEVWDVSHPATCNHFPVATFDSNGAGDDFHETHARLFCAALRAKPAGEVDVPVAYYQWLYGIERDVRVWDMTPHEIAALVAALAQTTDRDAIEAAALERAAVAFLHTMHMEGGQTQERLSHARVNPFGYPGSDYSEEYEVTCEPLYRALGAAK